MGFKWEGFGSRRKILIEWEKIINWICTFLQQIRKFRGMGKLV
jgi:hypothetical protein